jgi:3-isopropylmalate/(R)-2-methylmalate dehydratase large subunit
MASGEVWLMVPESVKVVVKGKMPLGVMSRDMMFHIMGEKGWDGGKGEWAYKAIEFTGETIKRMDMSSRLTTTNLVSDLGAKNGIIDPDNVTVRYLRGRTK